MTKSNIPRMKHLPSIQTLRAFEAAGRHQSYARAAEELGLTHGAISHRILELQNQTSSALFRRTGNLMVPTKHGHELLVRVRHALQLLEEAFQTIRRPQNARLSLNVLPAFASRWLVLRLGGFRAQHPKIEIDLEVTSDLVEIGRDKIEVAVRYGPGGWPDLQSKKLADEILFPVCAPDYRQRLGIVAPANLAQCTLLRHPWQSWGPWLQRARLPFDEPSSGPSYSDAGLLLQAAAAGEGVALARSFLAFDDLRAGRLVRLFDIEVPDTYAYYAVWRATGKARDTVGEVFVQWLASAMRK